MLSARSASAYPGLRNVDGQPGAGYITSSQWGGGTNGGCPTCHVQNGAAPTVTLKAGAGVFGSGTVFTVTAGTKSNVFNLSFSDRLGCNGTQCQAGGFLVMHADPSPTDAGMGTLRSLGVATHACPDGTGNCTPTTNGAHEVMHTAPLISVTPTFQFGYDAPNTCGTFKFAAWVNAVNADSQCFVGGDAPGLFTFSINVVCADDVNPCTSAVKCVAGACNYPVAPAGTICRAATGVCDPPEFCTGTSRTCPTDQHSGSTVTCRASAGLCDLAEHCNGGVSCPANALRPAGTICRPSTGASDPAEFCSGTTASCPPDVHTAAASLTSIAAANSESGEREAAESEHAPPEPTQQSHSSSLASCSVDVPGADRSAFNELWYALALCGVWGGWRVAFVSRRRRPGRSPR